MLKLIISGGQSGADLGGLLAAEALGIETGGEAPLGFRTEQGRQMLLQYRFGLHEGVSLNYSFRTMNNVVNSDATLIVATDFDSKGTVQTIKYCNQFNKPFLLLPVNAQGFFPPSLREFVQNIEVLNIAGNRESVSPGITIATRDLIIRALR
jgi:hypothetical protein